MEQTKTNIIEIDFGNHLLALFVVEDNKIKVVYAIDGWGSPLDLSKVKINNK